MKKEGNRELYGNLKRRTIEEDEGQCQICLGNMCGDDGEEMSEGEMAEAEDKAEFERMQAEQQAEWDAEDAEMEAQMERERQEGLGHGEEVDEEGSESEGEIDEEASLEGRQLQQELEESIGYQREDTEEASETSLSDKLEQEYKTRVLQREQGAPGDAEVEQEAASAPGVEVMTAQEDQAQEAAADLLDEEPAASVKEPVEDKCISDSVVMLPCGHIFGLQCIREWFEGEKKVPTNTCPSCRHKFKIIREETKYPPGFQDAAQHYRWQRDCPLRWYQEPWQHWQVRVAAFAAMVVFLGSIFEPPPWTSWTTIIMLIVGTTLYYHTNTTPVVEFAGWRLWWFVWGIFALSWVQRQFWGGGSLDWRDLFAAVVVFVGMCYSLCYRLGVSLLDAFAWCRYMGCP